MIRRVFVLPLAALVALGAAMLLRRPGTDVGVRPGPPGAGDAPSAPQARERGKAPFGLALPPGRTLTYRLKADVDVRIPFQLEGTGLPFEAKVRDLEVDFAIHVLESSDSGALLGVHPRRLKGRAAVGGASDQSFETSAFGELGSEFGDIVLFRLSPQGALTEILLDRRFDSGGWLEIGSAGYVKTIADVMGLFPPLPEDGRTGWIAETTLFDLVRLRMKFSRGNGSGPVSVDGTLQAFVSLLGKSIDLPVAGPGSLDELAGVRATLDPAVGYYRAVRQHVVLEGMTRVHAAVDLIEAVERPEAARPAQPPADRLRFGSWAELQDTLTKLPGRSAKATPQEALKGTAIAVPILDLDALLAAENEADAGKRSALEHLLRTLIESDPSRLAELRDCLRSRAFHERTRLQILQILSAGSIPGFAGVDDLVLELARSLADPDFRRSAIFSLQNHSSSEAVVKYLESYPAADAMDDQLRNMSLRAILRKTLARQEIERSRSLLSGFYARLGASSGYDPGLVAPFDLESPIVDDFIRRAWATDGDRKRSLKLVAMRAYKDTDTGRDMTRILEENLLGRLSDREVMEEFVPWAANGGKKAFFAFLAERGSTPALRKQARAYVEILERRERPK